jgi:CheY-like chemotaxis protein/anti-sigma regulatory factor (Ser/Thr protein kinase)
MPGGPMLVSADSTRLEQVLVNLLANAAKFTGPGGDIAIAVAGEGEDAVTIVVADNGRGIAPALLPRVFDMFTQGSLALDRTDGGLGIGLTVAHRLVAMHGGTISARSEGLGRGSEFTVTLPRTTAAAAGETPVHPTPEVEPRKILIVEDHSDAAEMLALLLSAQSHQVRVESNGHAALVAAMEFSPDVMLVDVGIPGMSGYDLAERIRSNRTLDHVLLIAVTGYGRPQDRTRALTAGFDHHLIKPVDADAIAAVLGDVSRPKRLTITPPGRE